MMRQLQRVITNNNKKKTTATCHVVGVEPYREQVFLPERVMGQGSVACPMPPQIYAYVFLVNV